MVNGKFFFFCKKGYSQPKCLNRLCIMLHEWNQELEGRAYHRYWSFSIVLQYSTIGLNTFIANETRDMGQGAPV